MREHERAQDCQGNAQYTVDLKDNYNLPYHANLKMTSFELICR
jgi:hypothetical protein